MLYPSGSSRKVYRQDCLQALSLFFPQHFPLADLSLTDESE
jgi:hypothetical protein